MLFRKEKPPSRHSPAVYAQRYAELRSKFAEPFLEHTHSVKAALISSISVLDKEMNHNGGANWQEESYSEYLDALREHLPVFEGFTEEEKKRIACSLDEIVACGRELETKGESSRNATTAVEYLICRVVDWAEAHPEEESEDNDGYAGHF